MKVSTPGVQKHFSQRPEPLTNLSREIWRSALLDHVAQNSARQISKCLQKKIRKFCIIRISVIFQLTTYGLAFEGHLCRWRICWCSPECGISPFG